MVIKIIILKGFVNICRNLIYKGDEYMAKKALIKCVDGILYKGIVGFDNDVLLILKDVKCSNETNNMVANINLKLANEITFRWDKILWITYKED